MPLSEPELKQIFKGYSTSDLRKISNAVRHELLVRNLTNPRVIAAIAQQLKERNAK